jgi:3-isopropylmalate dehydratase small subunit
MLLGESLYSHVPAQACSDHVMICVRVAGLDDIGLTLQDDEKISRFEEARAASHPWL